MRSICWKQGFLLIVISIVFAVTPLGEGKAESDRDYFKVGVITSLSGQNVWGGNKEAYEKMRGVILRDSHENILQVRAHQAPHIY